ncbi:MAG: hypothetical protein IJD93_00795 [Ruminococcus sp.]|nr:hypothetical protein [Ruminococcus sp.]
MSEIYIHYGNLQDSIDRSKKVRTQISGYVEEIKKRITTPISNLSGSDSVGYASTASSLAWQKINALNDKASRFSAYESSISGLISTAKSKDKNVSSQMETIAGLYIEKRTWYQKVGDWAYNTFCVDLANNWEWTRDFADAAKWIQDKVDNSIEIIKDWFKYGDGKYILNIVTAIGSVCVAIAAIIAIPFTGGATIPVVIGAIATVVSSVIVVVNANAKIEANMKALSLSGNVFDDNDGDPGAARYYGNIDKLSEKWNRTDMGGKEANDFYKVAGKVVDTTKVVADTTSFACNIANSVGAVRDYRFKNPDQHIKGYDFSLKNIKHNIRGEFGFYLTKPGFKLKNPLKTIDTLSDVKDTYDYFKGQSEKVENIWESEGIKKTAPSSDPFGDLESAWNDIKSPFKTYNKYKPLMQ